jgi:hypothetical protein
MKTAHENGQSSGQKTQPTDFPRQQIMQMAQEALDRRGPGTEIHFQFTCPACGARCTLEEANILYERGECYACGTDAPIEQAGFLLTMGPIVGPLTPSVGNA